MTRKYIFNCFLSVVSAAALLISATYAWLLNDEIRHYDAFRIVYGGNIGNTLQVVAGSLEVEVLYYDFSSGEYVEADGGGISIGSMVPNQVVPIKIRFGNRSGLPMKISLDMCGITADGEEILNSVFVGFGGGHGFGNSQSTDTEVPDDVFYRLGDASKNTDGGYDLRLYGSLIVPPAESGNYAELDGYFWLDRNATTELSEMSVGFGYFRIII